MDRALFDKMTRAITGFEMEIRAWRPTFKLSQNKSEADRLRAADELEKLGKRALAHLMRAWAQ
jgi:transcriptional regulator